MPEERLVWGSSLFQTHKIGDATGWLVGTKLFPVEVAEFTLKDEPAFAGGGYYGFPWAIEEKILKSRETHLANSPKGIKELYDTANGETAILCGSGPSLLNDVNLIPSKPHPGYTVFCLNNALKAVGPGKTDYCFALDWSARPVWYEGVATDGVKAILSFNVPGNILQFFRDRYYFAGPTKLEDQLRKDFGYLESGLLATFSCLHLIYKMGFKRVILLGHDFAYTGYPAMNHWDEPLTTEFAQQQEVHAYQDVFGRPVISDPRLEMNAKVVVAASHFLKKLGVEVINCAEGGLCMTEQQMPFSEALKLGEKHVLQSN